MIKILWFEIQQFRQILVDHLLSGNKYGSCIREGLILGILKHFNYN